MKNRFSLYMALFFIIAGIGWTFWSITTELFLNNYESFKFILEILSVISQSILLIFVMVFLGIRKKVIYLIFLGVILAIIAYFFFPDSPIRIILAIVIVLANSILFLINWGKNADIRSLGLAIGLISVLIGEAVNQFSSELHALFLIITAITWVLTFFANFKKEGS